MTDLFAWCGEQDVLSCVTYILFFMDFLSSIKKSLGDLSGMGTPGLISNPVDKHASADGTWRATSRESRSLPRGFFYLNFFNPNSFPNQ